MPIELPKEDSDGQEYIQFRGPQTSVTVDRLNVHFETDHRGDVVCHKPLPVVDPDAEDPPEDAVARPVAEELVESNPLICWGVVCEVRVGESEVCGSVFDTPKGEASHRSVHSGRAQPEDSG